VRLSIKTGPVAAVLVAADLVAVQEALAGRRDRVDRVVVRECPDLAGREGLVDPRGLVDRKGLVDHKAQGGRELWEGPADRMAEETAGLWAWAAGLRSRQRF
jgi:hypothetical protein